MYNKILAPLDGSGLASCVYQHVVMIAKGCQVPEVVLLKVVEPFHQVYEVSEDLVTKATDAAIEDSKRYLAEVADRFKSDGITIVSTDVMLGKPADVILDYSTQHGIDLIIMSTHGRSGISRWTLGSVTDRVVRKSPVPVLTVSPPGCT